MTAVTASILFSHLSCPHRSFMDAFASPSLRDPISPFVQMLWERGSLHEEEVVAGSGDPVRDLSAFKGVEKEVKTREAIQSGETLIYGGRLSVDELLGEPDLLRKEGSGYVAIDIKSGSAEEGATDEEDGKLKKTYGVQIALYTDILERLGVSTGRYGYIWDVCGDEVRYDLDEPLGPRSPSIADIYTDAKSEVERILKKELVTLPAAASVCKLCVWRSSCLRQLKTSHDLSLLPRLGRTTRDTLMPTFPTLKVLAGADLSGYTDTKNSPFPGVSVESLSRFQVRAKLALDPNPVPFFREPVELPTNPLEVFFDIEDDPMRDVVYLHGFVVRKHGDLKSEKFLALFAEDADSVCEREAFAAAWGFLTLHANHVVYYYSKHERTKYRKLQQRYPDVCSAEDVEALFSPGRSFDLYYDAVFNSEWPTMDWSIKSLAKFLKFKWRDTDPSGTASIEWFDQWVDTKDPAVRQRIIDYNHDDCKAMRVLLDAMRGMGVRAAHPIV